jgi:hypothetical protein
MRIVWRGRITVIVIIIIILVNVGWFIVKHAGGCRRDE